jgi:hypothetical protein
LVLQYFGSDNNIFAFERNTRTFVISICVVLMALPLLTYILNVVNDVAKLVVAFVSVRMGRDVPLKATAVEGLAAAATVDVHTATPVRPPEAAHIEIRSLSV